MAITVRGGQDPTPILNPADAPGLTDEMAAALARRFANEPASVEHDLSHYTGQADDGQSDDETRTGGAEPGASTPSGAPGTSDGGGDSAPAGTTTTDPSADPSTSASTEHQSSNWRGQLNGQDVELTHGQIEGLVALANWAQSLPPEIAQQIAALQQGQALTISRDQYLAYERWQQQQQNRPAPPEPDLSQLSPEERDYMLRLRQERDELQQRVQQQVPPGQQPADPRAIAYEQQRFAEQQQRATADYDRSVQDWLAAHPGLDAADVEQLHNIAYNANAYAMYGQQDRVMAPDGVTVLREANLYTVTQQALNYALATRPDLFNKQASHVASSSQSDADNAVSRKKANAASLAAAPAAAIPQPTMDPRKMTPTQLNGEIANAIRTLEGIQ